jgi:Tfp pilus assembly protein PilN
MIKINLVPIKEKKKRKEVLIVFCVAVVFLIVALGMAWVYLGKLQTKRNLMTEIEKIKEESKGYEDKINEIKDLESKEASLEAFKKTVKGISEIQRKVIVAVDQMALGLPDGVWVTNLAQGKGLETNKFTIQGYAFTQSNMQNYFNFVQKPGGFLMDAVADLKNISATVGNNKQIHQFEISFKVPDQGS